MMKSRACHPAVDGAPLRRTGNLSQTAAFPKWLRHPEKRWRLLPVLAMLCGWQGCATHGTMPGRLEEPASRAARSQPHVEIFRGLGGYMPGSEGLQQRLAARGISSTTSCSASARQVSRRILERRARGNDSPIVLMGYAVGGGGARKVAKDLAGNGVSVDAIILIDPSFFEPVPRNVRTCFVAYRPEIWQSWNPIMRGHPVKTESPETEVRLINLKEHDRNGSMSARSHLTVTADEWIQEMLAQQAIAQFESDR